MKQRGFTLIELLIAMAIIGVIAGIGLSVVASTLRSGTKTATFNLVKQNGEQASEIIGRSIRSAVGICTTDNPQRISIYSSVVDCSALQTPIIIFECTPWTGLSNGAIKKVDNGGAAVPITNESANDTKRGVKVVSCNFTASSTTPKRVTVDFTLSQGVGLPDTPDYKVEIPFHTEVTLRNF